MASRRERITEAAVAALGGPGRPAGVTVHRHRTRPIERDTLPSYVAYIATPPTRGRSENVERLDHDSGVERRMLFGVEVRVEVPEGLSPDAALDPHYVWVLQAMRADPTWGGLAEDTREIGSTVDAADLNRPVAAMRVDFEITYITSEDDPEEEAYGA